MRNRPSFVCAPGHETLAAELAGLVDGTWEIALGLGDVMVMANGATVPRVLPGQASDEALAWWRKSVTTTLARTSEQREQDAMVAMSEHPPGLTDTCTGRGVINIDGQACYVLDAGAAQPDRVASRVP
jgi:hypothetical protein